MRFWKYLALTIVLVLGVYGFFYFRYSPAVNVDWGLTFSYSEAKGLGFDDRQMYLDVLSDLKPKKIRLMTYWKDLEKQQGIYDFSHIDWQLEQAEKYNAEVLLVLGRKQPRWPECHEPDWYISLPQPAQDQAVMNFIKTSVDHFKSFDVITAWQVENEPYFSFGDMCPTISKDLFTKEVAMVRQLDNRIIVGTDSGERGSWIPTAKSGVDVLGATFYRVSYDEKYGGYYKYPVPPSFFRMKAGILKTFTAVDKVWDVELQMEPWFTNGAINTPLDIQKTLMNPKVFAENIEYAKKSGLEAHYLWGVEWWYWMAKINNDWGLWAAAKDFLN